MITIEKLIINFIPWQDGVIMDVARCSSICGLTNELHLNVYLGSH